MAHGYIPVRRDEPFLLPPDMRDWLPAHHLAWFVLDVVARVDTSALHARHPKGGVGRRAYDPDMLLAVLVYAYCTGCRSSRDIERRCEVDVAYRVLAANQVPDHTTIARFRADHSLVAQQLFLDVLGLCAAAGLATVGVIAVDGTKMAANAALRANRSRAQLESEVATMFAEAAETDAAEDRRFGPARGDELPAELADARSRAARLDAALQLMEAQRASADAAQAAARARLAARDDEAAARGQFARGPLPASPEGLAQARARLAAAEADDAERRAAWDRRRAERRAAGRSLAGMGRPPKENRRTRRARKVLATLEGRAERAPEPAEARVNVTDLDSRIMHTAAGVVQGYNAQAAVNTNGIIVAADVSADAADVGQCVPMMAATRANLEAVGVTAPIGTMLFDAGYCSTANLTAPGPDRLIATTKTHKLRRHARTNGYLDGDPPADATPRAAMEHRLRTQAGAALYGLRQHTVEPVFGTIKHGRGFRGFVRRGLGAVQAEWQLITAANNITKLWRCGVVIT
jgi:transposase